MKLALVAVAVAAAGITSSALADSTLLGHVLSTGTGLGSGNNGGYAHKLWGASDANTARFTGGAATEAQASTVYLFCVDANYLNSTNPSTYHLVDVTGAPVQPGGNPGNPVGQFTAANRAALNATAMAALAAGILDGRGFLAASFTTNLSQMVTIGADTFTKARWIEGLQKAIWADLGVDQPQGVTAAQTAIDNLAASHVADPIRVAILGVDNGGNQGQDMLVIVPLPPAGWAGLASLSGVGIFGVVRRRKLLQA